MDKLGKMSLVTGLTLEDFLSMRQHYSEIENATEKYNEALAATGASKEFIQYWDILYRDFEMAHEWAPHSNYFKGIVLSFLHTKEGTVEQFSEWTTVPPQTLLEWTAGKKKFSKA